MAIIGAAVARGMSHPTAAPGPIREPPPLEAADLGAWLDGFFAFALPDGDLAGAVIVVVKDGAILLQRGFGFADLARRLPMDPERTVVRGGSLAKLFTWTAVMREVERGTIRLDRDVASYLDVEIPATFAEPITVRHLMTHTAGFEERQKQYGRPGARALPLAQHLTRVPVPARIYPPGTVQAYSNYGNDLAAYVVERVSGEPFVDYVERHVLRPLAMERSAFRQPVPDHLRLDLAKAYPSASDEPIPPDVEEPTGDLVTTAADMVRFIRAHLDRGRHGNPRLLAPTTFDTMHAPSFVPIPGAPATTLGFFGATVNGHRILQHSGDLSGFHTDLALLPDQGIGMFLALNSDGHGGLFGAAYRVRASVFRRFMDRYFPPPPDPEEPTVPTATEHADLVAGEYEMSRRPSGDFMEAFYLAARVQVEANPDGTIETPPLLDFETGRTRTWREVGPFVWLEVGGRTRLRAKVENGRVRGLLPDDLSGFLLEPVSPKRSGRLNLPLLAVAGAVLAIATGGGPIAGLIQRHARAKKSVNRPTTRAGKLARVGAMSGFCFLLSWGLLLGAVGSGAADFTPSLDPWIRLIQLLGLLCLGGLAAAMWNAWVAWRHDRSWWVRLSTLLVALALLDVVWFSLAFDLISAELNY